MELNVELTPGSDSGGKDDFSKDDYTKDDYNRDNGTKDDGEKDNSNNKDPNKGDDKKDDLNKNTGVRILVSVVIVGAVIGIVVFFRPWKKKGQKTSKTGTIKNDDWTTCPKCGTDLKMKDLPTHIDSVHPKLSKTDKEQMIERRLKQ